MGTTPARLTRPTVGLMPTTPLLLAGHTMLPSVSVPIESAVKFAGAAAPEPELEPHGLRLIPYGLLHWPPRPDQPLVAVVERKLAHSLRVVFPKMTAPAARSRAATVESCDADAPTSPSDPAAVCISSWVSMLSLSRTGIPCSGPRAPRVRRSWSSWPAISRASGLSSMTEFTVGPL